MYLMQADNQRWARDHFNRTLLAVRHSNTRPTRQDASKLGGRSFRVGSKWFLPRLLLRNFNGAMRRRCRQLVHCVYHHLFIWWCSIPDRSMTLFKYLLLWMLKRVHHIHYHHLYVLRHPHLILKYKSRGCRPFHTLTLRANSKVFLWKAQRCSRCSLWGKILLIMQKPQLE